MGGRMGQDRVTLKEKEIMGIKDGMILISGPIPGSKGDMVAIFEE
jgi:ribosomal protein L3